MAQVQFSHPLMTQMGLGALDISTKPDQITWAYGLNTAVYPTYGGEVVQILSVYFDDMTIAGTVSTYAEMERIYTWFVTYMQFATQGRDHPSYDQHPVKFFYPERNWTFLIWPKALPGFRYGRDVVAPTWQLTAAVKEPDATVAQQIQSLTAYNASVTGKFAPFGKTTADFGSTADLENNPWASPNASIPKGQTMSQYLSQVTSGLTDTYSSFVNAYANSALDQLPQFSNISKPPSPATAKSQKSNTTKKAKKVGS